jgi:hypothetical protein
VKNAVMEAEIISFADHASRKAQSLDLRKVQTQIDDDRYYLPTGPIQEHDEYYLANKPCWTNYEAYLLLVSGSTEDLEYDEDWRESRDWEKKYVQYKGSDLPSLPEVVITQSESLRAVLSPEEVARLTLLRQALNFPYVNYHKTAI